MSKQRTLVFDLDGTLVDSVRDLVPALNRTTARDGLPPIAIGDVGQIVGKGAFAMIAKAFDFHERPLDARRHRELLKVFLQEYEDRIADQTVYFDGLWDALDPLKSDGWVFAICTNKFEHLARKLVQQIGRADEFVALTGGDTFAVKKPDPAHLVETIRMAGGSIDSAIMVGDSNNDIDAARAAKIPSIAVDFGYTDVPPADLGADRLISHFSEFPDAVRQLAENFGG